MPSDIAVLVTLRILRTGSPCQQFDDQTGFSQSTINVKFKLVVESMVQRLGPIFLPDIPHTDIESEVIQTNADRGFNGCAGSLDCTHVTWRCPKALQPIYKGKEQSTTVVAQCIAAPNLFCTHCFVGSCGTNNDINTLRLDGYIHRVLQGPLSSLSKSFSVSGETFDRNYFLVDGIYPAWSIFVSSLSCPVTIGETRFAKRQESCRKDVERLFGVVKQRFKVMRTGNRIEYRDLSFLCDIVRCCFILHNIIVLSGEGKLSAFLASHDPSSVSAAAPVVAEVETAVCQYPSADDEIDGDALISEFGSETGEEWQTAGNGLTKEQIIAAMVQSSRAVMDTEECSRLRQALVRYHSNVSYSS
jgi:hypothetical protein